MKLTETLTTCNRGQGLTNIGRIPQNDVICLLKLNAKKFRLFFKKIFTYMQITLIVQDT